MRAGATSKGAHGSRKLPLDAIKESLADGRVWVKLGIVAQLEGETSHYELDGEDLLVDVELMPDRVPLLCRLGVAGGGAGRGIWWVPQVGTEVLVAVIDGDLEADGVIVACLSTGAVPAGLDATTLVIKGNPHVKIIGDNVTIEAENNLHVTAQEATIEATEVVLGNASSPTLAGLVNGACIDSFTGTPYSALHGLSNQVKAPK